MDSNFVKMTFNAVVKGYHECTFHMDPNDEDKFVIVRKYGERGQAFEVLRQSDRRQLGHLQKELVPILWSVGRFTVITGVATGDPYPDPSGRYRTGGGLNVPLRIELGRIERKIASSLKRKLLSLKIHPNMTEIV